MLKRLHIINFESHKDTVLEFSKTSNSIIGKNDRGKSSIIRAVEWIVHNFPLSPTYKPKYWKPDITHVILETYEGDVVERRKNNKINEYILNGKVFTGFGSGVPEEIQRVLNISDINCQFQLDPPLLLTSSHGEISRYLNKIVNLDVINTTQARAEKKNKEIEKDIKIKEKEKKLYEETLFNFEDLCRLESLIEEGESLQLEIIRIESLLKNLKYFICRKEEVLESLEKNSSILKNKLLLGKVDGVYQAIIHIEKSTNYLYTLVNTKSKYTKKIFNAGLNISRKKFIEKAEQLQSKIKDLEYLLQKIKDYKEVKDNCEKEVKTVINIISNKGLVEDGIKLKSTILTKVENLSILTRLADKRESYKDQIKRKQMDIKENKELYKEAFPNGVCPLCGGKIDDTRII